MKLGKGKRPSSSLDGKMKVGKPTKNQSKKNLYIIAVIVITALLITWVYSMGRKAEETVQVCMTAQNIYKNQVITESMLQPYDMLKGEFEKFATVQSDGTKKRRVILWTERDMILNTFAAYPLQANNYCEYRSFIKSRTDNSDNVLYSFPGKEIVPLDIATDALQAFKTFLQPGDRVNVTAIFAQKENIVEDDGFGGTTTNQVETFRTEPVFSDIMIADLINSSGDSILDIYADYRDKTVYQQAQLDSSQTFKDSVEPKTLLVALTPEEKERYYDYVSKSNVSFKMSLPQRVE